MKINKAAARAQFKKDAAKFRSQAEGNDILADRARKRGDLATAKSLEHVAEVARKQAEMAENYKFPKWVE